MSVIITTYGDQAWLDLAWSRAWPSAQDQGAYEVIVHHDDGQSIGPARNNAAAKATGEWLCFLDADDELEHEYIRAMTDAICSPLRPEPALLQPAVRYLRKGRMQDPILIPFKDLRTDNFLVIGTVVRRRLFEQVGGFGDYPHGFEDWSCWAKCWKAGAQIFPVPHAIYNAHINPHSKHREMWRDRRTQVATHLRVQKELFPETA